MVRNMFAELKLRLTATFVDIANGDTRCHTSMQPIPRNQVMYRFSLVEMATMSHRRCNYLIRKLAEMRSHSFDWWLKSCVERTLAHTRTRTYWFNRKVFFFAFTRSQAICHLTHFRPISIVCHGKNQLLAHRTSHFVCLNQFNFILFWYSDTESDCCARLHRICVAVRASAPFWAMMMNKLNRSNGKAILTMNICDNWTNEMMNTRCIRVSMPMPPSSSYAHSNRRLFVIFDYGRDREQTVSDIDFCNCNDVWSPCVFCVIMKATMLEDATDCRSLSLSIFSLFYIHTLSACFRVARNSSQSSNRFHFEFRSFCTCERMFSADNKPSWVPAGLECNHTHRCALCCCFYVFHSFY